MHYAYLLFGCFFLLMFGGVPIAAALGLSGTLAIALAQLGIMAVPTNVYAGIAKYPLLAIPMFVLAGAIFDKAGVAERLLRFTEAIVGRGRGALAVITILVGTFSEDRDERAVEVELANGKIVKYIKAEKRTFNRSWDWLPSSAAYTYDQRAARNELRTICYNGNTTTIRIRNVIGSYEDYTVFVDEYSEEIIRRDPISGCIYYNVSVGLRVQ